MQIIFNTQYLFTCSSFPFRLRPALTLMIFRSLLFFCPIPIVLLYFFNLTSSLLLISTTA